MDTRSSSDGRIRQRIAAIDNHIAVLMKERDELIFAERVLDRLGGGEANGPVAQPKLAAESTAPDSIEAALLQLESKHAARS